MDDMSEYEEMGYAKLDTDREARTGFPEVVFCSGKPDEYLVGIYTRLYKLQGKVLGTRADEHQYEIVKQAVPEAVYNPVSRILEVTPKNITENSASKNKIFYKEKSYIAVTVLPKKGRI